MGSRKLGPITIGMAGAAGTSGIGITISRLASGQGSTTGTCLMLATSLITTSLIAALGLILNYRLGKQALQARASAARRSADLRITRLELQRAILDKIQDGTKAAHAYQEMTAGRAGSRGPAQDRGTVPRAAPRATGRRRPGHAGRRRDNSLGEPDAGAAMKSRRVGVIVPQGSEFGFIRESLPFSGGEVADGEQYHHFQLPQAGVTGVLRVLSDMGQAAATLAADRMISRMNVSLVVLIGTAAGLASGIRLGDVVVADQIQEYLRKTGVAPGPDDGSVTFERAVEAWRTNARLLDHVSNFGWLPDGEPAIAAWKRAAVARRPGDPGGDGKPAEPDPAPAIHVGPVATGDVRVAGRAFADWIRRGNRKLAALDMEAGGAALAAYRNDSADLLVIRGVSDYADERKGDLDAGHGAGGAQDAWRRYAVRNAIEYLMLLLSHSGFPWRDRPATDTPAALGSGSILTSLNRSGS